MTQKEEKYIITVENDGEPMVCYGHDRNPFIGSREDAVALLGFLQEHHSCEVYRVWRLDNGIL